MRLQHVRHRFALDASQLLRLRRQYGRIGQLRHRVAHPHPLLHLRRRQRLRLLQVTSDGNFAIERALNRAARLIFGKQPQNPYIVWAIVD